MNGSKFATDFVQVMECWGNPVGVSDPSSYVSTGDGPARENCEYGATPQRDENNPTSYAQVASRITSTSEESYGGLTPKYVSDDNGIAEIPFNTYDGKTATQTDRLVSGVTPNNSFFNDTTTNEIDGARTTGDGTGHVWFQTDTAYEAPGLGCGLASTGGSLVPCWLVIVPRGHVDSQGNALDQNSPVATSPLTPFAWKNRIAIPLTFAPLDTGCPENVNADQANGSQLVGAAMTSWQPALCNSSRVYSFTSIDDNQARSQLASGGSPFIFTSQPLDSGQTRRPVVYAPVTLSGVTIGFNIEQTAPVAVAGRQLLHLNLTPRLVAKLLTYAYRQNYTGAVTPPIVNLDSSVTFASGYEWLAKEPFSLPYDPEFKKYNPDLYNSNGTPNINGARITAASVIVELGNTDVAQAVWQWVLADPSAKAWLQGTPDQWGMVVPPTYTLTSSNTMFSSCFPANTALCFPQNDSYANHVQSFNSDTGQTVQSAPITMVDYHPYASDTVAASQMVLTANDNEKTLFTPGAVVGTGLGSVGAQPTGSRMIMSITDTASAQRFGIQEASLSAAGDDGDSPTFVAPSAASLTTAVGQMKPAATGSTVLWPDPSAGGGSYPLAILTYAVTIPTQLSKKECADFSKLLTYASAAGQVSGDAVGELPRGYVSLPESLSAQTQAAATTVASCPRAATTTPTPAKTSASSSHNVPDTSQGSVPVISTPDAPVVEPSTPGSVTAISAPVSSTAPTSTAPVLILAAGTTPNDPTSFTAALPIGVIVGVLAGIAAPLLSGVGLRFGRSLRRLRLPRIRFGR
jgi:hypothetical protein